MYWYMYDVWIFQICPIKSVGCSFLNKCAINAVLGEIANSRYIPVHVHLTLWALICMRADIFDFYNLVSTFLYVHVYLSLFYFQQLYKGCPYLNHLHLINVFSSIYEYILYLLTSLFSSVRLSIFLFLVNMFLNFL